MPRADPTPPIVLQRTRNRIIEYLELVALAEHMSPRLKTADLVNIWEDSVRMPGPEFSTPPFTDHEIAALAEFAEAWESFCVATPEWPGGYEELFAHPAWPAFREAASRALAALSLRGRLPEDSLAESSA
jgi:hypothetical protein